MDTRQQLINIFNTLQLVEVKGQNVMFLGQCMSQLMQIINSMPNNDIQSTENISEDKQDETK